ncbi:MAG: hypothetical protein RBS39_12315 [Phycisphaerales bacterium]|jgi:Fic family protein|nr:hypothetical protein [Phycisphaerales bacterium]
MDQPHDLRLVLVDPVLDGDYHRPAVGVGPRLILDGRIAVLTTLLLLKAGYAYTPYSSLESVIEQSKEGYYLALRRTQGTLKNPAPDWSPWLVFFLRALQQQKVRLEAKIEREKLMRASMPELAVTILDLAAEHGQIGVGDIMRITATPRGTVKKRLAELVEAGHLKPVGQGRGAKYTPG